MSQTSQPSPTTVSVAKTTRPGFSLVLNRERLFSLLDEGTGLPVVWIDGPAGAGKTTLTASYLSTRERDSLWYRMDPDDTGGESFFFYLEQAAAKHLGRRYQALPAFSSQHAGDLAAFSRHFFRRLFGLFKKPFVLVLDNYQTLRPSSGFQEILDCAIAEVPKRGCIIVVSRRKPPAEMARYRASEQIHRIEWKELRFTGYETTALAALRGSMSSPDTLEHIQERTDGWAAGLVLMLEYMRASNKLPDHLVQATPQVIFDYLGGEIFRGFEATVQRFLLQMSCLRQVTPSLAETLSGDRKAQSLLINLSQNNYFVSEMAADPEPIYQFHPLFLAFLRHEADQVFTKDQKEALYEKAARSLANAGELEDALPLLQELGRWDLFATLVKQHAPMLVHQDRTETLMHWLDRYPVALLQQDSWLLYWSGACRLPSFPRQARHYFDKAYGLFQAGASTAPRGEILSCAGVISAIIEELDDLTQLDRWLDALQSLLDRTRHFLDGIDGEPILSTLLLATALRRPHDRNLARWCDHAQQRQRTQRGPSRLGITLAMTHLWAGRFPQAKKLIELMAGPAHSQDWPDGTPGALGVLRTSLHLLAGEHEACRQAVEAELARRQQQAVAVPGGILSALSCACRLGEADPQGARMLLEQLAPGASTAGEGRIAFCLYYYLHGWYCTLRNNAAEAFQDQKMALRFASEIGIPVLEALCHLALAQTLAQWDDHPQSAIHLDQARQCLQNWSNPYLAFITSLVEAALAYRINQRTGAGTALPTAMALGREHDFTFLPNWQPDMVTPLCIHALETGCEIDYVRRLIRVRGLQPAVAPLRVPAWPWRLRCLTLGKFQLIEDETPRPLSSKGQHRPLNLLKALLCCGGKEVRATWLATALWPKVDEEYAYKTFTINLHRLRKLLGDETTVILREGRLSLNPASVWVDTWAFEQVLLEVDECFNQSPKTLSGARVIGLAGELFGLYQGGFLADEQDQPFYEDCRRTLREQLQRSVSVLGAYWENSGEWDRAADIYRQGIASEPLAETLYIRLLTCYRHLQRRADAIAVVEQCQRNLPAASIEKLSSEITAAYGDLL